ncbi:MAG: PAS domain-containing sensor histidine kinase [Candidatus Hydrogenedentes bacterium]|nr:PAS domain-containing sensor histidine kinase [Candidatus Hydrogenedentota bacterium]
MRSPIVLITGAVGLAALPGVVTALILLREGGYSAKIVATLAVVLIASLVAGMVYVHTRMEHTFRTISNMLMALREGDFSLRATRATLDDALGEVLHEINTFGDTLRDHRLEALEATTLLRKIMAETDVAIFAFDAGERLKLINRAGAQILGKPPEALLGAPADQLGLSVALRTPPGGTVLLDSPRAQGRWGVRRGTFREDGLPHQFLVLANLDDTLRQEELHAWQRLVRVLGHEINNTLTPIASMASSLREIMESDPVPPAWRRDADQVLNTIETRTMALSRFTQSYARLARLPQPNRAPYEVRGLVERAVQLEASPLLSVEGGPVAVLHVDSDQMEQVLINLLRNGLDAAPAAGGRVSVSWRVHPSWTEIVITDNGSGLLDTANLFVPFFTTKPMGSGIGLVLSRQIVEAHGGTLTVVNRVGEPGCIATIRLPRPEQ